jgi:TatD DNase family protein
MIDCGVNLSNKNYDGYIETLKQHSKDNGVNGWITISNSEKEWTKNIGYCNNYSKDDFIIKMTFGIHPHNAKEFNENSWENLELLLKNNKNKIIAIGECGLDYNRLFSSKEEQKKVFISQIELANKYNLPLYLHERDAHEDFYEILNNYKNKYPKLQGIIHCFTGSENIIKKYLEMGFYIGITGWICDNRRNTELLKSVKILPIDKLIIETDSPYLTPLNYAKQYKTKINQPDSLIHIVTKISEIKQININDIIKITIDNSNKLFNLTL